MQSKLFGLYSLENAVYFGAEQYIYFGESVFYSKKPSWASTLLCLDEFSEEKGYRKDKKTFVSVLGLSKFLNIVGIEMLFKEIGKLISADSSVLFNVPMDYDYAALEKTLSKSGFLIYEEEKTGENEKCYLAVKKLPKKA